MLPHSENKLNEIRGMISTILSQIILSCNETLTAFEKGENDLYDNARNQLNTIQNDANKIDTEIIKMFALFGPEADELRILISYLKMTNELNSIGKGMRKYTNRIQNHVEKGFDFTVLYNSIIQSHKTVLHALQYIQKCLESIEDCDVEDLYTKVMIEESKNDDFFSLMEKEILSLIITAGELSGDYVKVLGTLRKLERAGDRALNIAALLVYAKNGGEIHTYL
jgi:phosphate transport system protein